MANLTANQRSFIEMMQLSDEHAIRGFELLLKRERFLEFFDSLLDAGLFGPDKNPAPVQADKEGRYRIPYWRALDYLVACAKVAGERDDLALAEKILRVIRTANAERDPAGERANVHTFRRFAEIFGLLPTSSVTAKDLELLEGWLNTKFDRDMVANAIDDGALPRFLSSSNPADWEKALQLFKYCTTLRWQPDRLDSDAQEPVTVVDDYWLKKLVGHHAAALGRRIGPSSAGLMVDRVRQVFGKGLRADHSHLFRSAVEGQGERHGGHGAEDVVVEALRDVLLGWTETDAGAAKPFVDELLRSDSEMLRRIGIHVLNERWDVLENLYLPLVRPELFAADHLPELYRLLKARFESFSEAAKERTIESLHNIASPDDEEGSGRVERLQIRWLDAISGTSYAPATTWFGELTAKHGPPPRHPDQLSYIETRWGSGPSQYSAEELVALTEQRTLASKLAAFKPSNAWEGPTVDALADQLERAVQLAPITFARVLPDLLATSITHRHAVINGFLKLWREPNTDRPFAAWDDIWPKLFDFFEILLADPMFWDDRGDASRLHEVTPMWIASAIADLLQAGTRDDGRAYPATLLPRGWDLIQSLLAHGEAVSEPSDDPMMQAINSTRGRALEAAFSHALRVCRLADKELGSHGTAWNHVRELFDKELTACESGNFEFSTLAGAYAGNLEYLSSEWLEANVTKIFPVGRRANLLCAISGLAYASPSRRLYQMLRDSDALDAGLRLDLKGRHAHEKLMERVAVGYLWGEESLDSNRFRFIFESRAEEALPQINFFLSSIRGEKLEAAQVQRILDYWRQCLDWAANKSTPPMKVLSSLSGLIAFLPNAAGENSELLLATAPYVHPYHGSYDFLEELGRLVESNPNKICAVLRIFIDTHEHHYDYEDRMRTLVERLAEMGHRSEAIEFCDKLRHLPGLYELFLELTAKS